MRNLYQYILLIVVMTMTASCERRDLFILNNSQGDGNFELILNLILDIENEDVVEEPDVMVAAFFDPDTKEISTTEYIDSKGGVIFVPPGMYHLLVYSYDTYSTHVRADNHYHTIEAYTNPVRSQDERSFARIKEAIMGLRISRSYLDQVLVYEPDHMFVCREENLEVLETASSNHTQTINEEANSIVKTYTLVINNIKGTEYIAEAHAYVTGQINRLQFGTNTPVGDPATLYLDMNVVIGDGVLTTKFRTFGRHPQCESNVYLIIEFVDTGGTHHSWEWDVTEQFDNPDSNDIIVEGNIEIEDPMVDTGNAPTVGPWEDNVIKIEF